MNNLRIAWFFSTAATLGSLYFSEWMGHAPCTLCWYQRILMYPLVGMFLIAMFRKDTSIFIYALPFSIGGGILSAYHYILQKTSAFGEGRCSIGVPCNTTYIDYAGFITIPFLSLLVFIIINASIFHFYYKKRRDG